MFAGGCVRPPAWRSLTHRRCVGKQYPPACNPAVSRLCCLILLGTRSSTAGVFFCSRADARSRIDGTRSAQRSSTTSPGLRQTISSTAPPMCQAWCIDSPLAAIGRLAYASDMSDKTPQRRAARAFRELERSALWGAAPARGVKTALKRAMSELARETGERLPRGWHWSLIREDRLEPHDPSTDAGEVTLCVVRDGLAILRREDGWLAVDMGTREELAEGSDLAMVASMVSSHG